MLAEWVGENMAATEIEERSLRDGAWLEAVDGLLREPRRRPPVRENGAEQAAELILDKFGGILK